MRNMKIVKPLLFAAFSVCLFLLGAFLFNWQYFGADTQVLLYLFHGTDSAIVSSPYLLHVHYSLAALLGWLQNIWPCVDVLRIFLLFLFCASIICMITLAGILYRQLAGTNRTLWIIEGIIPLLFVFCSLFFLEYTVIAQTSCIAGLLCFWKSRTTESPDASLVELVIGALFVFLGILLRYELWISILPFVIIYLVESFLPHMRLHGRRISVFMVLIASVLISVYWHGYEHNHLKQFPNLLEYNSLRIKLVDYPGDHTGYNNLKADIQGKTAYRLIRGFNHYDTDIFSLDTLKEISEKSRPNYLHAPSWPNILFWVLVSVFLLLYLTLRRIDDKTTRRVALATILVAASELLYLWWLGRLPFRSYFGIVAYALWITWMAFPFEGVHKNSHSLCIQRIFKRKILFLAIIILLVAAGMAARGPIMNTWFSIQLKRDQRLQNTVDLNAYVRQHPDIIYFVVNYPAGTQYDKSILALGNQPKQAPNLISLFGWHLHTPTYLKQLARYGIKNPAKAIIRTDVRLVFHAAGLASAQQLFLEYMREVYGNRSLSRRSRRHCRFSRVSDHFAG